MTIAASVLGRREGGERGEEEGRDDGIIWGCWPGEGGGRKRG